MPRPDKPERFEEQLDAALDGVVPGVVIAELVPLLEAADELRAACARSELGPTAARRHLATILATPVETVGPRASRALPRRRWTRRVAGFALAAALLLTPLVVLSASDLPGEPLYPVKLTVENARLTAALWSPDREAGERTRIARTRLSELDRLVSAGRVEQIPTAISALDRAVAAAQRTFGSLTGQERSTQAAALDERLRDLRAGRTAQLTSLPRRLPSSTPVAARVKIEGAVERSLSQDEAGTSR
jgi:hypothetical protein